MKRLLVFLQLLMATATGLYAQHLDFVKNSGEVIHHGINFSVPLTFEVDENDELVWTFDGVRHKGVSEVIFRDKAYDDAKERETLIELYNALDGDHWRDNTNWCSDKPLDEWYGVYTNYKGRVNWIDLQNNNLKGEIPESIENLTAISSFYLGSNPAISGKLPQSLGRMMQMENLAIYYTNVTGTIPDNLLKLPRLKDLKLNDNQLNGELPEALTFLMDKVDEPYFINIANNQFSGKVPEAIVRHKNFRNIWPGILMQKGVMDLDDVQIPGPDFELVDMNGNVQKSSEVYARNKLTLLYQWGSWCPYSTELNVKLIPAYNQYKEKGFEVIGFTQLCPWAMPCDDDEAWLKYLENNQVKWPNVCETAEKGKYLKLTHFFGGYPTTFLVDQNGMIVHRTLLKEDPGWSTVVPKLEEYFGALEGGEYYTSSDYSQDGKVYTMQTATIGRGINLVFMGDGYTDKDMAEGGKYEQAMQKAMEQFFSIEPYKSLRNRFNVYGVKAVSPNAEFSDYATRAISRDDAKAFKYASKIPGLRDDEGLHVNVIYNTGVAIDRSYCSFYYGDNSYVSYMMDGVSMVLNHESGGHGIGRLLDEYVEPGYEVLTLPDEKKTAADSEWADFGRGANIDWRSDPTQVKWAKFISDSRYAAEGLGAYEGSWLYGYGAYRPTQNSMMRYNDCPFNAPSREAIYKYVMRESEGAGWTYDYETFVAFDEAGRTEFVNALNSASRRKAPQKTTQAKEQHPTAPPVYTKGTWRDVLSTNSK